MSVRYLHAMIRTDKPEESHTFYTQGLGLVQTRRMDSEKGQFSLIYYATEKGAPEVELTHNWDDRTYSGGDQFGHLAFEVDNIYDVCANLQSMGVTILRPPRDGHMAFIKDPNNISIELLQKDGSLEPAEPWLSMENTGSW
ncbi:Lactoylglutathione lyase [Marinomonas spartinae]|uniref:Lactoylglutathione lyase n=1 Tax=Marinomonas spartinae TaxID=1792290 RepID=A0A1A8TLM9_9GAMM|nr:VOC family protein [Marinomonas spartinae]SBS33399.1 Lactoylglutathione lyase [Marinomonas spartinae]SBS34571.1 Lactoylglutathione lyase [Marinomonas spartinae]